ncbi:MAG: carotenoid 1,2-hydratase [Nitrospinae bacterium CG11_big_fil_rev_8_21_14_0_20_56_8]|nr:MAG: carotenoid 1,2-hydratase [Nitrospinae bacterium CG11_big_fil_rev_8_21_14_0_20_56_8]
MKKLTCLWNVAILIGMGVWSPPALAAEPVFKQAAPGYTYVFPRDLGSHDDFRIEWWYYTGNLEDESGKGFGYQLTFFRVGLEGAETIANPSRWKVDQVYFAHLTLTDLAGGKFYYFERVNRPALGIAGAEQDGLRVWNENWTLQGDESSHKLRALEGGTGLDLTLVPLKPPVFHGRDGISRKGPDARNASHYFSYTRMRTSGTLFIRERAYTVKGTSWMDHEFSGNPLNDTLAGWDWFSLKLDNSTEIMLYQLRRKDGGVDPFSSGTWIPAQGPAGHLEKREFTIAPQGTWTSPETRIVYPSGWEILLPASQTQLTITPDLDNQELAHLRSISASYWEGSVTVKGTMNGQPVQGKGYVELVGYGKGLRQELPE